MDADVVGDMINNLDLDTVALSSDNPRAGKLAVDSQDGLGMAQSCHILQSYLQQQQNQHNDKEEKLLLATLLIMRITSNL